MDLNIIIQFVMLAYLVLLHLGAALFFLFRMSWKIPVVILRFTGHKGRPVLIVKRGKKVIRNGVPKLFVKGYKDPINDFKSHNYYPTPTGGFGGLILWEYEDGQLTPAIPEKIVRSLSEETKDKIKVLLEQVQEATQINFDFDERLYDNLRLKAVDDVDIEGAIHEVVRTRSQYRPGWLNFLQQYGWIFGWIVLGIIIVVCVVYFFNKAPELVAQCSQAALQNGEQFVKAITERALGPPA